MSVRSNKINNLKDDGEDNVREDLKQDKSGDKTLISGKQESPKDDVKRINTNNGVKIVTAKNEANKNITSKTMQHLLSDWRTAISNQQVNTQVRILFSMVFNHTSFFIFRMLAFQVQIG